MDAKDKRIACYIIREARRCAVVNAARFLQFVRTITAVSVSETLFVTVVDGD